MKKPKCKLCGGTGNIRYEIEYDCTAVKPCPTCCQPEAQTEPKCKACYDKGYYTQFVGESGSEDFGGEGYVIDPHIQKFPCPNCRPEPLRPTSGPYRGRRHRENIMRADKEETCPKCGNKHIRVYWMNGHSDYNDCECLECGEKFKWSKRRGLVKPKPTEPIVEVNKVMPDKLPDPHFTDPNLELTHCQPEAQTEQKEYEICCDPRCVESTECNCDNPMRYDCVIGCRCEYICNHCRKVVNKWHNCRKDPQPTDGLIEIDPRIRNAFYTLKGNMNLCFTRNFGFTAGGANGVIPFIYQLLAEQKEKTREDTIDECLTVLRSFKDKHFCLDCNKKEFLPSLKALKSKKQ